MTRDASPALGYVCLALGLDVHTAGAIAAVVLMALHVLHAYIVHRPSGPKLKARS